jgi:hypothetical protein
MTKGFVGVVKLCRNGLTGLMLWMPNVAGSVHWSRAGRAKTHVNC